MLADRRTILNQLNARPNQNLEHILKRLERSHQNWLKKHRTCPVPQFPDELPITAREEEIRETIQKYPVTIVAGETGSGKTTQLPKICLRAGLGISGKIACTQPRRVAALSVSQRIAEELKVSWGDEVGAKIRFTDKTSDRTYIKMMTDGMLLSEIQSDPDLNEYEVIIVDEAHERSLNIDFILGYLKILLERRNDLKVIITSATIDTDAFSKAFGGAPVIQVSGRTFPVEVIYAPPEELENDDGDVSFLDGAAEAVLRIIHTNQPGDILIFLPSERDIRELREMLAGKQLGRAEILPLFGRLSNAEQQRIFAPTQSRKIVIATNIAETSITIPGIRYVIDGGLARISRYNAQTHTKRLPIEPISQSSADQRKGRAGRVSDGVCIRLYSEKDYLSRPKYSVPEILRSNLAEVILRMIAFGLGRIDDFPFIAPPSPGAIRAGYSLLEDLGALDPDKKLTELGAELARLPCDPTVGRMLLQARTEGAIREVLVIASALSIQDPRERPADAQEAAQTMHRKFQHDDSDFLSLLNIWDTYHDEMDRLSQRQLRRYCHNHFLNYQRMREWRDIHQQLHTVLKDFSQLNINPAPAEYHQIHRSLLSGLLSNIAEKDQGNHYKATHQRKVMLFPGSGLFDKKSANSERRKGKNGPRSTGQDSKKTPSWIVCAEWTETSRVFARTAARIEPSWAADLGRHLIARSYSDPYYEENSERVLVKERQRIYGLEIAIKRTGFLRIDPKAATELFVREALVNGLLKSKPKWFENNQALREEIEDKQTRLRSSSAWQLDERVFDFYIRRISNVGSYADLRHFIKNHEDPSGAFLNMKENDLLPSPLTGVEAFPDQIDIEGVTLGLDYKYKPGEENDGATLRVPVAEFSRLNSVSLDWAVPGYIENRIQHLLKGLPKETRVQLHPIGQKVQELAQWVQSGKGTLIDQLEQLIHEKYGVRVWPDEWQGKSVPDYLRPRIEIIDENDAVVVAGRELDALGAEFKKHMHSAPDDSSRQRIRETIWNGARKRYERDGLKNWSFEDFPKELTLGDDAGIPVVGFPGLRLTEDECVSLKLFDSQELAKTFTPAAFTQLVSHQITRDIDWIRKELSKELRRVNLSIIGWIPFPTLERAAISNALKWMLRQDEVLPLRKTHFQAAIEQAKSRARALPQTLVDLIEEVIGLRKEIRQAADPAKIAESELPRLLPINFLDTTPYDRLSDLVRYLNGLKLRIKRARTDPIKDREKAKRITPYEASLQVMGILHPSTESLRWALEEYRIQVFAQELGTRERVSAKLLDEMLITAQKEHKESDMSFPTDTMNEIAIPAPEKKPPSPAPKRRAAEEDLKSLKASLEKKFG